MTEERKSSDRKIAYNIKFNAENTVLLRLRFNKVNDADIIEHLNKCENKQGYIKRIIREDIARTKEDSEQ